MNIGELFRRLSTEDDKEVTDMTESVNADSTSRLTSLFSAPSKLIESVNTKTGHFVSDIGGKISNLRQASVDKFEHAVRGAGIGAVSAACKERANDTIQEGKDESSQDYKTTPRSSDGRRSLHNNPFNLVPEDEGKSLGEHGANRSNEQTSLPSVRRRSSSNMPRPPRPPPPTPTALSRAISLDEGSRHNRISAKLCVSHLTSLGPTAERDEQKDSTGPNLCSNKGLRAQDDNRDGESSASEYGADGDLPIYKPDDDDASCGEKETSIGNGKLREQQVFIGVCVSALVCGRWSQNSEMNEKLSELLMTEDGRMAFVNKLEMEANLCEGQLEANALPDLLEKINLLLTECQDAEDFKPAKKILTTSLLFHSADPSDSSQRDFLFTRIKHLPIWQSLRFWNACFFQSVQEARLRSTEQGSGTESAEKIAYGQLKSYISTMGIFNLHHNIMQEFLRKHGCLFNLTDDEMQSLQASIDSIS